MQLTNNRTTHLKITKMEARLFILITFLMFNYLGLVKAQQQQVSNQGIQFFEGSWADALDLAKKENKPIFLDVYASWCAPCKVLKKKTFPDAEAGKYFNENFINVSLDGEKGDGIKLVKQLNVQAYPSLFILNSSGTAIVYYAGYLRPEDLIELGKAGLEHMEH